MATNLRRHGWIYSVAFQGLSLNVKVEHSFRRITTISATNHIGHDHIGHRRNRPQTTSATAYTISATSKVHIGHRQLWVTIGLRVARMPCEMRTDQNSNPRRLRTTDGLLKPTQAIRQLLWTLHDYDTYPTCEVRARAGGTASLCHEVQASVISSTNLTMPWNHGQMVIVQGSKPFTIKKLYRELLAN